MRRPGEETLIRFFRGQCLPDEEHAVKIYLAMNVDREYVEACLGRAFPDLTNEHDENISRQELDRVWDKLESRKQVYPTRTISRSRWLGYAAAIAFLILSCASVLIFKGKSAGPEPAKLVWHETGAGTGNTKSIKLSDSSTVVLFPGSVIRVPENFNNEDRQVKLKGRAFFRIAHNAAKPFYVSAQGLTTKVLGTSFEINTSEITTENIITLHTGSISVMKSAKEIARLVPDQQIRFNTETGKFKVTAVHAAGTINWLDGELEYDQAPLGTIVDNLEKWYGVSISADKPAMLDRKVTISFKDLPIADVLAMLSESADFNYTINNKHISIKERSMKMN